MLLTNLYNGKEMIRSQRNHLFFFNPHRRIARTRTPQPASLHKKIDEQIRIGTKIFVNLYKEYSYLKLRDLEELPCFGVIIWQPFRLL